MLTHLQVRDFAIIDAVEVELRSGLTVLTGETGAGKSILVDALQLLAGGRAGADVVRHGCERAELSATFELARGGAGLRELLDEQGIDTDGELVVRRVVNRDGKSRCWLNGQQVPLQVLRNAAEWLVDIHGQHEFQSLARPAAQRALLDTFAAATALAQQVAEAHRERLAVSSRLDALLEAERQRDERLDLLRHQAEELARLDLAPGEADELVAERQRLMHAGRLRDAARTAQALLYEADEGAAQQSVGRALAALRAAAGLDARLAAVVPLVDEALIRINEAARDLGRYLDALDANPARQDQVEQRLAVIENLARKHRVPASALPARAQELQAELERLATLEQQATALRAEVVSAVLRWRELATQLSSRRVAAARELSVEITARMQTLGMAGGRFEAAIQPRPGDDTSPVGLDEIEFLVTANPGQPPRPVGRVASGGELSRLSLAVQVTTAARERAESGGPLRCMVFDEVDSGVGGAVAEIVGRELAALAASAQVLCVTHLPQVAAQGHHHLRVAKRSRQESTHTQIAELDLQGRIEEIARMLGGVDVTGKAREHAAEMLEAAAVRRAPQGGVRKPGARRSRAGGNART